MKGLLSVACSTIGGVYALVQKRSGQIVQLMSFLIPKKRKSVLCFNFEVMLKVRFTFVVEKLCFVPSERSFGSLAYDKSVRFHYHTAKSNRSAS